MQERVRGVSHLVDVCAGVQQHLHYRPEPTSCTIVKRRIPEDCLDIDTASLLEQLLNNRLIPPPSGNVERRVPVFSLLKGLGVWV
jgi:hypothetical protein